MLDSLQKPWPGFLHTSPVARFDAPLTEMCPGVREVHHVPGAGGVPIKTARTYSQPGCAAI
ncbi:hypothetical protein GCM10009599_06390 [Luteococcus peritonei]